MTSATVNRGPTAIEGGASMTEESSPSVLSGLPTFEWNSDEAVRYEVAVEAISQAAAAYTAAITRAEQRGDTTTAQALTEARTQCARDRDAVRSADVGAVQATITRYRGVIEELRTGR
jgi:hypothetical protein